MKFRVGLIAFIVLVVLIGAGMFLFFPRGGTKNGIYFKTYDGVYAKITGSVIGNANDITLSDLTYGDGAVPTGEDLSSWQVELEFGEEDEITILINVENKNTDSLYVIFKDDGQIINNVSKTIKNNGELYNSGRVIMLQSNNDTTLFTVTFKRDQDVITNIRYNYHIELKAEITDDDIKDGSIECEEDTGYTYTFNDSKNTATIKGIKDGNTQTTLVLPSMVVHNNQMYIITTIGQNAFKNKTTITSVVISSTVTELKASVFEGCTNLTNVTIPTSVTKMGNKVFKDCSRLQSIELPSSLKTLGDNVFSGCSFPTLALPDSITNVSENTFSGIESINELLIPCAVTAISGANNGLFAHVNNIEGAVICVTNKGKNIGCAFRYAYELKNVEIPNGVESIADYAFSGCEKLTEVLLPNSLTYLGASAFGNCFALSNVSLSTGMETIKSDTFYGCESLKEIFIPSNIKTIEKYAFSGCLFRKVITPSIQDWLNISFNSEYSSQIFNGSWSLFENEKEIKQLIIPDSTTTISSYAFWGLTKIDYIVLPTSITEIGTNVFNDYSMIYYKGTSDQWQNITGTNTSWYVACHSETEPALESETKWRYVDNLPTLWEIPEIFSVNNNELSLTTYGRTLKQITIPSEIGGNSVTKIAEDGFAQSRILSIEIPSFITSINTGAFFGCKDLVDITIPNSITTIPGGAFYGCVSINELVIPNTITRIGFGAFRFAGINKLVFSAGMGAVNFEKESFMGSNINILSVMQLEDWFKFNFLVEASYYTCYSNPISNAKHFYVGEEEVVNLIVPNTVQTIKRRAFISCECLQSVYIPSSVINITAPNYMESPFYDCRNEIVLYVEPEEKPSGWHTYWYGNSSYSTGCKVYWGVSLEEYQAAVNLG